MHLNLTRQCSIILAPKNQPIVYHAAAIQRWSFHAVC